VERARGEGLGHLRVLRQAPPRARPLGLPVIEHRQRQRERDGHTVGLVAGRHELIVGEPDRRRGVGDALPLGERQLGLEPRALGLKRAQIGA
jgi:hypothetical protein